MNDSGKLKIGANDLGKRLIVSIEGDTTGIVNESIWKYIKEIGIKLKFYIGKKEEGKCIAGVGLCKPKKSDIDPYIKPKPELIHQIFSNDNDNTIEVELEIYENYCKLILPLKSYEYTIQKIVEDLIFYNDERIKINGQPFEKITLNRGSYHVFDEDAQNSYLIIPYSIK